MDDNNQTDIVKQVIDDKGPLKGKGWTVRQWRDDAQSRLDQIYAEMAILVAETSSIAARTVGLKLYSLRHARQLRWRFTNGRHATWPQVEPSLAQMSPALAQWYREAQEAAQVLNHREQVVRYEIRTVERLLLYGKEREARPYKATVGTGFGGGRPPKAKSPSDGSFAAATAGDAFTCDES
ncbi:MAG: hypothetical protein QM750_19660 [Rubrivivax sp.]